MDEKFIKLLQNHGHKVRAYSTLRCWTKENLVDLIRNLENNWAAAIERYNNQFEVLNKYRWHDLRTNPDDLPEINEKHILVFTNEAYLVWNAELLHKCKAGVDRWKRIEPFEEVE